MHTHALMPHRFFFYPYGPHRDLHSFPTRRSSDLAPPAVGRGRGDRHLELPAVPERGPARAGTRGRERGAVEDRKSTRLNSSHSQISYAVFCLKKKKKQTDD